MTGANTTSRVGSREACQGLCDEALIKHLEAAIYSTDVWQKALDVLCKRIASREVSENMLLHIVLSLSKSTAVLKCTAEWRR
jgi:hypothetical protein